MAELHVIRQLVGASGFPQRSLFCKVTTGDNIDVHYVTKGLQGASPECPHIVPRVSPNSSQGVSPNSPQGVPNVPPDCPQIIPRVGPYGASELSRNTFYPDLLGDSRLLHGLGQAGICGPLFCSEGSHL
uniref:Uncharacterized protein n=1 Tax=Anas platyrhynchos TaxID=8839 RepID=A0A8B9T865_ANAPL